MGIQFLWEESYSVGNREIDDQHKRIFALANDLPETHNLTLLKGTLLNLHCHAYEHFSAEERMMKAIGFPKIDEHRKLHNSLISELDAISKNIRTGADRETALKIKRFVHEWIMDHILTHDMEYFRFVQGKNSTRA